MKKRVTELAGKLGNLQRYLVLLIIFCSFLALRAFLPINLYQPFSSQASPLSCPAITITPTFLANGVAGGVYNQVFTANGGSAPYSFTIVAGKLSAGLTFSTSGAISGTPTLPGSETLTIKVTDAASCTSFWQVSINIEAPAPCAAVSFASVVNYASTTNPRAITTGDFNNDGRTDLAAANYSSKNVSVLLGNGNGSFGTATKFTVANNPSGIVTGDFNNDGKLDLAVANFSSNSVSVLLGNGNGTFGTAKNTTAGSSPTALAAADFNNDGKLDLVVANSASNNVSLMSGNGTGTFTRTNFAVGTSPQSITTGDFNADGKADFAVANGNSNNSSVLLGNGSGGFGTAINYTVGTTPKAIVKGDFNHDNVVDLAVANSTSSNVSILLGSTGGSFLAAINVPLSASASNLATADVNGDGNLDLVATTNNNVLVLLGNGSGGFTTAPALIAGTGPFGIAPGDFNGDYLIDLAVANNSSSNVSVLLNNCCPNISLSPSSIAAVTVGTAYQQTITASGGQGPFTYSIISGVLPAGLTLSNAGVISGTATAAGNFNFVVRATNTKGCMGSANFQLTSNCPTIQLAPETIAGGAMAVSYNQTITATGGTAPYSFNLAAGSLPPGLSLAASGTISGTPSAGGNYSFTVNAVDVNGCASTRAYNIYICPIITISPLTLENVVAGSPYHSVVTAGSGTAPYTFSLIAGILPVGLQLANDGTLSGTTNVPGNFNFTVATFDANGCTGSRAYTLSVVCPTITLSPTQLADGVVGSQYSRSLTAIGGVSPHTFAVTSGALPAGLSLTSNGLLSGTPTAAANSNFTITATDANGCAGNNFYSLIISLALTPATLPNGIAGNEYNQSIAANGGIAPYSFAITAGALPNGLSLNTNGAISGTMTEAGSYSFTITSTDSNGLTGNKQYSVVVSLGLSPTTLPGGLSSNEYNHTLTAIGGAAPYTFAVSAGTLPSGLTLSPEGTLSGIVTDPGSSSFTVIVTDNNNLTGSQVYSIVVCGSILFSPTTLPNGSAGTLYNQTITASGSIAPYMFTFASGSLPPGVTLAANGTLSGTPSTSGSYNFTVMATDANGCSNTQAYQLTTSCAIFQFSPTSLPFPIIGIPYNQVVSASGCSGPYSYSLLTGTLPPGLSLASNGTISGTPTALGIYNFTVRATDGCNCTGSKAYQLFIGCPVISTTPTTLPNAVQTISYSQTLTGNGGMGSYTFSLVSGTLPAGLTLASNGTISGTPTTVGTSTFSVRARDPRGCIGDTSITLMVVSLTPTLSPSTLSTATAGLAYSQTITANGPYPPYTISLAVGSLPPGMTISGNTITGVTPLPGSYTFTLKARSDNGLSIGTRSFTVVVANAQICNNLTFSTPSTIASSNGGVMTATADFNGDGKLDIAMAASGGYVSIFLGDGIGNFSAPTNFAVGQFPKALVVGDFNLDSKLDIAVASQPNSNVSVLMGDGTGSFSTAVDYSVGSGPTWIAAGDFNGDSYLDLVTSNSFGSNVSVLINNGTGGFGTATSYAVVQAASCVAVGDINGDGKLDLAIPTPVDYSISFFLGNGNGGFNSSPFVPRITFNPAPGARPQSVILSDINKDGKLDLLSATEPSGGSIYAYFGDGTGRFNLNTSLSSGPISMMNVNDFNGDGSMDVAVSYTTSNTLSMGVALNNGTGGFGAFYNPTGTKLPISISSGDINGDGKLDLIVGYSTGPLEIFINSCQ